MTEILGRVQERRASAADEPLMDVDARQARVVTLRYLAGMSAEEVAHVLGISTKTVQREWRVARAWLAATLGA